MSGSGRWTISRYAGQLRWDRRVVWLLMMFGAAMWGWNWLQAHPQHNPWAPLDLRDPPGWATERKLLALRDEPDQCRAVLERSDIAFDSFPPTGQGACRREDRTRLADYPLAPDTPPTTCAVAAAMELWLERGLRPAAQEILGEDVERIEHLGAYSCRRLYGRDDGPWSEHATANAIDIAAIVLSDGTRISVLRDWGGDDRKARFLRRIRDEACGVFGTVLSPDYNEAHRDHFHFDQKDYGFGGVCR